MDIKKEKDSLRQLGVELLVQFGSTVSGHARDGSDIDIGVLFNYKKKNFRQYGKLYSLLQEHHPSSRIDLVDVTDAPYTMQYRIAQTGLPLYESHASQFANFREQAILFYLDFLPIIKIHEDALRI